MDDEKILNQGGTQEDIEKYAKMNGADLTEEDINSCPGGINIPEGRNYFEMNSMQKESPRRFVLSREVDITGVSGTGKVAEGVLFTTGWVALTWLTDINSLVFYPDIANVEHIHGHNGSTKVVWLDN